jgi:hypothetical protein
MQYIYALEFMEQYDHNPQLAIDHVMYLGLFSTYKKAREARDIYLTLQEYKQYSKSNFYITKQKIGVKFWATGFV